MKKVLFLSGVLLIAGATTLGMHYASSTNDLLTANVEALSWGETTPGGPCGIGMVPGIHDKDEGIKYMQVTCVKSGEVIVFGNTFRGNYTKGVSYSVNYETSSCQVDYNHCCDPSTSGYHILYINGHSVV